MPELPIGDAVILEFGAHAPGYSATKFSHLGVRRRARACSLVLGQVRETILFAMRHAYRYNQSVAGSHS